MKKISKGEYLSELRKKKNLTQKDLGDLIHYSDKNISKWEMNKSFPEDEKTLSALAEVLGVTVKDLERGGRKPLFETIYFKVIVILVVLVAVLVSAISLFNKTFVYIIKTDNKDIYIENGNYIINHEYIHFSINSIDTNSKDEIDSIELFKYNGKSKSPTLVYRTNSFPIDIYKRNNSKALIRDLTKYPTVLKITYKNNTELDIKLSFKIVNSKYDYQEKDKNNSTADDAKTLEEYLTKVGFVQDSNSYIKSLDENSSIFFNKKTILKFEFKTTSERNSYSLQTDRNNIIFSAYNIKNGDLKESDIDISNYKVKDCNKIKCNTEKDYIGYLIFLKDKINIYEKTV
jgi:hypothetical protein